LSSGKVQEHLFQGRLTHGVVFNVERHFIRLHLFKYGRPRNILPGNIILQKRKKWILK